MHDLAGAVVTNRKHKLMACSALLGAWLVVPGAASAQMSDADKIQALERQTQLLQKQLQEQSDLMRRQSELMQQQLKEVKDELARARGKTEKVEASSQKVEAKAAAPSLPAAPPRQSAKSPIFKAPPPAEEKVKVTLGGFVTADTVWRQRNMVADMGTPFNAIPFPFSPLYDEHEFHGSARESRISLLIEVRSTRGRRLPAISRPTSWASGAAPPRALPSRIITKATPGRCACGKAMSLMTTAVGDFTSSPAKRGALPPRIKSG